jgi:hypothetical protein
MKVMGIIISIVVNMEMKGTSVTHDAGNIVITLTHTGTITFCKYPPNSNNHLFLGAFAIGTTMPYVIDNYYEENGYDDNDWKPTPTGIVIYEPYPPFAEYSVGKYSDSLGEEVKGIICEQHGFTWDDPNGDDFIIIEYNLTNTQNQFITGLYTGVFLDWDIGDPSQNQGGIDTIRKMAYLCYDSTYMGSAILNPPRTSSLIKNLSVIDHDIYVYPYQGLPDSVEIKFLNGTYSFSSTNRPYDWSTCISAGPFDLAPNQVIKFAIVIGGGKSLEELQTHIDTAYARYWSILAEEKINSKPVFLKIYPTISKGEIFISYNLHYTGRLEISIIDRCGRIIKNLSYSFDKKKDTKKLNLKELPQGIYMIKIETPYINLNKKIILIGGD